MMKTSGSIGRAVTVVCLAVGTMAPTQATAQSTQSGADMEKWQFTASIYGFLPAISGTVTYAGDRDSSDFDVPFHTTLSHLKMTFMGALDVHNGRWGIINDVLYLNVGAGNAKTRDFKVGDIQIPVTAEADVNFNLKGLVWTVAGEYRISSDPTSTVDLIAGARLLNVKPSIGYSIVGDLGPVQIPVRNGSKEVTAKLWDGIVGIKGRHSFGDDKKWFLPYYLDVGTGQTKFTWQGIAGLGYSYGWGDIVATWRYLDWNNKSGKTLENLTFNGPLIGVNLRW